MQELSYDPWGRLRNPANQELYAVGGEPTPFLGRGYTGHEHLFMFGLVNMNARLYDPAVGRFLSPDPYVQSPDFSQNFNRYSYCVNNPLKYSDKSGEFFIIDDWIIGGIRGLFNGKGFWKGANDQAWNSIKIWGGLFVTDPNRNFWGRSWQLISRFTWEAPQTVVGFFYTGLRNEFGGVDRVDYLGGATFATNEHSKNHNGVTIGSYVNMNIRSEITGNFDSWVTTKDPMYMHEYGHYIDSQSFGLSYLFAIAIPSGFSCWLTNNVITTWKGKSVENYYNLTRRDVRWYERRANKNASSYFKKYYNVKWDSNKFPKDNPFE